MTVPDFMIWHCANCGAPADGTKKPCECLTDVGVREGPNGRGEQTFWDDPPDPRDAAIFTLRAAVATARAALEPFAKAAAIIAKHPDDYEFYIVRVGGLEDCCGLSKTHFARALAAIDAAVKGKAV